MQNIVRTKPQFSKKKEEETEIKFIPARPKMQNYLIQINGRTKFVQSYERDNDE